MRSQALAPDNTTTTPPEPAAEKEKKRRPLTYNPNAEIVRAEHWPLVTGLSHMTLWRKRRDGDFVPVVRLGENSLGARRADLHAWLASRESK